MPEIRRTVEAHQAQWSENRDVVVFWFDGSAEPSGLKALDATGKALPTGRSGVGHG